MHGVTIIDDYAHHPQEIAATLAAAANYPHKKLWCVFQPHTYSRTKAFLDEFAQALSAADEVVLADIFCSPVRQNTPGRQLQRYCLKNPGCRRKRPLFPYF